MTSPQLAAANDLGAYQSPFDHPLYSLPAGSAGLTGALTILFFLAFAVWAVYTAIAAYHWFRYGHRSWIAVPAVGVHIAVSAVLILLMASGAR